MARSCIIIFAEGTYRLVNRKLGTIIALLVIGLVAGGLIVLAKTRSAPPITVTLRIQVNPVEQLDFVLRQANSARFKFLVGKDSGVKPIMAQKLSLKKVPKSPFGEAHVNVMTRAEAKRYIKVFMERLQAECAGQAQVTLTQQAIR